MNNATEILRFLARCVVDDERAALITVTRVIGSSSRAPGTHMAVSETGASVGSLSGGCVEAAVVAEALRIIADDRAELIRFGAGSRFIDIRLPCGGGLDLLIVPRPCAKTILTALDELKARRRTSIAQARDGRMHIVSDVATTNWRGDFFISHHRASLRIFAVGHGAETSALARLALSYGAEVTVLTPDPDVAAATKSAGAVTHMLRTAAPSPYLATDRDCAVVLLFHDHDWEVELLAQTLTQEAFFVGAMGSRETQVRRLEALRLRGVSEADRARIIGPVGLIAAARDPQMLALSVLAQIAERRQPRVSAIGLD